MNMDTIPPDVFRSPVVHKPTYELLSFEEPGK